MTDPQEAIAYHEARHALISMRLGYTCLYVTIVPDGDRLGHVCCEDPLLGHQDQKSEHALKVLIAGRLAERRHAGSQDIWGDAEDRIRATNIALSATDRDTGRAKALINKMVGETRALVDQHWAGIEALARRLLVEKTVQGVVQWAPRQDVRWVELRGSWHQVASGHGSGARQPLA